MVGQAARPKAPRHRSKDQAESNQAVSEHKAKIIWNKSGPDFVKGRYSREHTWEFDGGLSVPASPSPSAVPAPYCNPDNVDPEEAFVAAISSCHMLTFLYLAAKAGFHIDAYEDDAVGVLTKNAKGVPWISRVTLNPQISFGGQKLPTADDLRALHHGAHDQCFIANSVLTEVLVADVDD